MDCVHVCEVSWEAVRGHTGFVCQLYVRVRETGVPTALEHLLSSWSHAHVCLCVENVYVKDFL